MKKAKELEIPDFLKYKYNRMGDGWHNHKIELPRDKIFYTVVTIMRANPPHVNHTAMLRELCNKSVNVKINLGSSNQFNEKNPFRIEERQEMIDLALKNYYDNYEILRLPDFGDDEEWFNYLYKINDSFSEILSNNQGDLEIYERYQHEIGQDGKKYKKYDILFPTDIISQDEMDYATGVWQNGLFVQTKKPLYVSGTFVRAAIVNDWDWENFVDEEVADYLKRSDLVARVKKTCKNLEGITLEELEEGR